jgi:hypothetical protein
MWKYLNSAFVLWVLTTVVGGSAVWSFERYLDNRNRIQGLVNKADMIDIELEGRVAQYSSWVDGIVEDDDKNKYGVQFRPCVTKAYLHASIRVLGDVPVKSKIRYDIDYDNSGCPHMFQPIPIYSELSDTSLLGLLAERTIIEQELFPVREYMDPEEQELVIGRDPVAAEAISAWRDMMDSFFMPEILTGFKKALDYDDFQKYVGENMYSSPRQKKIFVYGDCFRC